MLSESNPPDPGPAATRPAPPEARPSPMHPDSVLRLGAGLGVVMVLAALLWVNGLRRESLGAILQPADAWQVAPGAAIGALFAGLVWWLGRRLDATRRIVTLLAEALDFGKMTFRHVILFSLLAAFPEELLFRGAVQPSLGLLAASVIFGALHAVTRPYFVYATLAGLLLGGLYLWSGSLWLPIGAHFAVDVVTFTLLLQRRPPYLN